MEIKGSIIFLITVFLLIIIIGCTPQISKEDLKVSNIIWEDLFNNGTYFASIEAEISQAPLFVTTEYQRTHPYKNFTFWEPGCANVIKNKGKNIISTPCLGDPMHSYYPAENILIRICFNYGNEYKKERICLEPFILERS